MDADRRPTGPASSSSRRRRSPTSRPLRLNRKEWTVLNSNFKEELTNVTVKPSDKLLWLGAKDGPWEIEMKIPQKHIGQVLQSFHGDHNEGAGRRFPAAQRPDAQVQRQAAAGQDRRRSPVNKEDKDEAEPVVLAYVRIDNDDPDLPKIDDGSLLPPEMLLPRHRSPRQDLLRHHPMGYSLFYGVFEFLYEKVVFFF